MSSAVTEREQAIARSRRVPRRAPTDTSINMRISWQTLAFEYPAESRTLFLPVETIVEAL